MNNLYQGFSNLYQGFSNCKYMYFKQVLSLKKKKKIADAVRFYISFKKITHGTQFQIFDTFFFNTISNFRYRLLNATKLPVFGQSGNRIVIR